MRIQPTFEWIREQALKFPALEALPDPVSELWDLGFQVFSCGRFPQKADELLADQVFQGGEAPSGGLPKATPYGRG